MLEGEVVEIIHGKFYKFEVVRKTRAMGFLSTEFWIRRDGKPHRGPYSDLRAAVEAARKEG
jgi:hypothetical protein